MRRRWTGDEIRQLAARYPADGATSLASVLLRSANAVTSMARRLNLRSATAPSRRAWQRATGSPTVNSRFFEGDSPPVGWVLGVLWACGRIKTGHRHVLKIAVQSEQRPILSRLLALLECRHQVQAQGGRLLVEIGNSRIVKTLIERFGRLPSRWHPDPPPPPIAAPLFPAFAAGLLEAAGWSSGRAIHWTTSPRVAEWVATSIARQLSVNDPAYWQRGRQCRIAWTRPDDVRQVKDWLIQKGNHLPITPWGNRAKVIRPPELRDLVLGQLQESIEVYEQ